MLNKNGNIEKIFPNKYDEDELSLDDDDEKSSIDKKGSNNCIG